MRLVQTIAFRLFLIIASIQTVALILLAIATINIQQSHLMENVELSAQRMSDIITRSTRYSMLLNRKEEVQHIIASVGGEPGIEGIRIYNKAGEVMFATVASDIHSAVDVNAEACISSQFARPPNHQVFLQYILHQNLKVKKSNQPPAKPGNFPSD